MATLKILMRVKAFTLLEVTVASMIVAGAVGVGSSIFVNVSSSSMNYQKVKAYTLLNLVMEDTEKNQRFFNEQISLDKYRIEKTVASFEGLTKGFTVHLKAISVENKVVAERKEILLAGP